MAEPLSERELAILGYLPSMMSNQEIAGALMISVNTVKTHLKAIYRKLEASGRREAVQRARELALIASDGGEPCRAAGARRAGGPTLDEPSGRRLVAQRLLQRLLRVLR